MAFRDELDLYAPHLYRFACALIAGHKGPCARAAGLVRSVLLSPLKGPLGTRLSGNSLQIRLYSALVGLHRRELKLGWAEPEVHAEIDSLHLARHKVRAIAPVIASPKNDFAFALMALELDEREALLLVALAGFTQRQAARILKISPNALVGRLARARVSLEKIAPAEQFAQSIKPRQPHLRLVK